MIEFLVGVAAMFATLAAVGLTRGRWLTQGWWVFAWASLSAGLTALMSVEFLVRSTISELVYGLSLGYVLGVTWHTVHHARGELKKHAAG